MGSAVTTAIMLCANAVAGTESSASTTAIISGSRRFPTVFLLASLIGTFSSLFLPTRIRAGIFEGMTYKYDTGERNPSQTQC